ncbi:MAG: transglycosylase domain-containing protein [Dehalococcoidia bacterium]
MPRVRFVSRWRRPRPIQPPVDPFKPRFEAMAAQGRTMQYLLQSCIAQVDALLGNPGRPFIPPPPNAMPGGGRLKIYNRRYPRRAPTTAHRGLPLFVAVTLVIPALLLFGGYSGAMIYDYYVQDYVPPQALAVNAPSRGARIYDRNGELLYEYVDDNVGIRVPVSLDAISQNYIAATIATEDNTFFSNPGVNPKGLARAAWENLSPASGGEVLEGSGGSSITQQLIKNVYIPQDERLERSLERKLKEAAFALELTGRFDKDQILDWYVNQISYGGLYNGVEAAANGYFGKPAAELTLAEGAMLAGIPQSPAAYDPRTQPENALIRRNEVLDIMARSGPIQIGESRFFEVTPEMIEEAKATLLVVQPQVFPIKAPHFVLEHLTPELEALFGRDALLHDGLVITTTLDMNLQTEAQANLERWIREFEDVSNSRNGAMMVLDAQTGEILVWIGSRDYFREDIHGEVDNLTALNSPGSSFKPFVYLDSFIDLGWTPSTMIEDSPVTYREADGSVFQPRNPNKTSYLGNISIRNALGNSLNVPPFKTALRLGVPSIVNLAKKVGFTTLTGQYGPAISIGGVDLSAEDLTYGYSVLANNGAMVGQEAIIPHRPGERTTDPVSILRVQDALGNVVYSADDHRVREQVVPAAQAYMVTSILADPSAQCVTFGCGGISIPGRQAGVKTGTSEPYDQEGPDAAKIGETWAFGYTPNFVVGVWAGNSDNSPIVNIFSTSISFRVMRDTLQLAHNNQPSPNFPVPGNIEFRRSGNTNDVAIKGSVPPTPAPTSTPPPNAAAPAPTSTRVAETSSAQVAASISTPSGRVSGAVPIYGSAYSSSMQSYRLEFGSGASPSSWQTIGSSTAPVQGGTLGTWNTAGLAPGQYAVRLVIQDRAAGTVTSQPAVFTVGP